MAQVKSGRRSSAEATRRKIIHAAEAEFLENGFHGATIASVAKRAGVAQQTVYFVFHNKAALISAVIDNAVMGEEAPEVPQESEWWAKARAEPDAGEALRIIIEGAAKIFARASGISEVLRAAALTDEELRRTFEHHENLRYEGYRQVIEMLASKGAIKKGLNEATATDVFMTVYSDTTYYLMKTERGWSHEQIIDWLCDALPAVLLEGDRQSG